jgi:hypothetical protein
LHFLRTNQRSILDSLDASQQNMFAKTLSVMHAGNVTFPNSTSNDNFDSDFNRDYFNQFGRFIPYDFVNQVIPIIFKATGQETLDVVTLPPGKASPGAATQPASKDISTQIVKIPIGITTKVRLALRNTGDVTAWASLAIVTTGLQSALGINGLTPSAITSPNIPQTLFSASLPVGIVGPHVIGLGPYYKAPIPPNTSFEFDINVYTTHYVVGTIEMLNVRILWTNVVGELASQTYQVYFEVTALP